MQARALCLVISNIIVLISMPVSDLTDVALFFLSSTTHHMSCRVNPTEVSIRNVYGSTSVSVPFMVAGKQQRDPVTGVLLYLTLPTVAIEFDTNCDYTWGVGNGILNATSNLLTNCWGALTKKDAWLGKKYHISSCSTEVSGDQLAGGSV
jgi:hypothetical protein